MGPWLCDEIAKDEEHNQSVLYIGSVLPPLSLFKTIIEAEDSCILLLNVKQHELGRRQNFRVSCITLEPYCQLGREQLHTFQDNFFLYSMPLPLSSLK